MISPNMLMDLKVAAMYLVFILVIVLVYFFIIKPRFNKSAENFGSVDKQILPNHSNYTTDELSYT